MGLSLRAFTTRIAVTPVLAAAASAFGAITSSWWAAALMGFGGALLFTLVSERFLRGVVMGKIGRDPLVWYIVHLAGETITLGAIAFLFNLAFGAAVAASTPFFIAIAVIYIFLCHEMLGSILRLLPMWLATRGDPK